MDFCCSMLSFFAFPILPCFYDTVFMDSLHVSFSYASFFSNDRSKNSFVKYISRYGQYLDACLFCAMVSVVISRSHMVVDVINIPIPQMGLRLIVGTSVITEGIAPRSVHMNRQTRLLSSSTKRCTMIRCSVTS